MKVSIVAWYIWKVVTIERAQTLQENLIEMMGTNNNKQIEEMIPIHRQAPMFINQGKIYKNVEAHSSCRYLSTMILLSC